MATTEKILLGASVLVSWLFVGLVWQLLKTPSSLATALLETAVGIVLWLTPFALLALFSKRLPWPLLAFALGNIAFLLLAPTLYTAVGIIFLTLGFVYWFLNVRYTHKMMIEFSVMSVFSGMGLFFTILAMFGGLVYYSWPEHKSQWSTPQVPESFFNAVYTPVATVFFSSLPALPQGGNINPQQAKPAIYSLVNAGIARAVQQYQSYVPFIFAGGVFFLLRAILFPLSYILYGLTYLLVELFLRVGWLTRQTIQVSKEVVSF